MKMTAAGSAEALTTTYKTLLFLTYLSIYFTYFVIMYFLIYLWSQNSTMYSDYVTGRMVRFSNHGRGKRFFPFAKRSDRLWGLPSLLLNEYRDYSWE